MIKYPKTLTCNAYKCVNDYEYDNDILIVNKEVYDFTTSYFVTEPEYDKNNI